MTVVSETVQIEVVVDVKPTVNPDEAVARDERFSVDPPRVCVPMPVIENEIVCVVAITKLASTVEAAMYFELPD